ncbi:MAG TPA: N-acetyl-gamma-glutamyl-phosphate reductase [Deltaproteobacteria bacterium]|nr:N-acetyl-gamma-glutamyl-phosphate reductase [Deltaproteobacteria bacterium]HPJ92396.1 N-acetyl-gamma-glutamyl-phosphate reductase [Deltaproteobacteria bacterium]HPR50419.1 N-acetyl-gamma-glutamyl-phosphate reductase [Deltaproteobacteria bacterium]
MSLSVGILGATGYTGAELIRLLQNHEHARITYCSSRQYNGKNISEVLGFLQGCADYELEEFDAGSIKNRCDVVFSCLPHGLSMGFIADLLDSVKVVDLSADFRIHDEQVYTKWYTKHSCAGLLSSAAYGLCEIYRDTIRDASLVANPGCYPTSVLLPLIPLLKEGLISPEGIIVDSKSGVSGAGRGLSLTTHICESGESFSAYKVGRSHRHIPEIEQELSLAATKPVTIEFTPHLIPISRGMLSTIYVRTEQNEQTLKECLDAFYNDSPFVHILQSGFPSTKDVRATNRCIIGLARNETTSMAVIVSVIDNLTKGASGQAVQNMNIMFGLKETAGLDSIPVFP